MTRSTAQSLVAIGGLARRDPARAIELYEQVLQDRSLNAPLRKSAVEALAALREASA